jgi:CheY-like chemotaxis protein
MSHEIRTPLNAIIGFADILSRKKLGRKQREHVRTIKSAGENLLVIINDILDISKIEAGLITFEEKHFSIRDIFKSVNQRMAGKAEEKDIELSFNCDPAVPEVVFGDPSRLTQVIMNLTDNAIKFTYSGKVQVNANVLRSEQEKTIVEFSVKDTGIGIPEDKLQSIFERFRQAESHATRKYGGSGLGLSIAKELVELQGGVLSVASKLKEGSVFSFSIPYKRSAFIQPVLQAAEQKYNIHQLAKLRILLVEDNRLNVLLVENLFSENKLKLEVAENGSECLDKLRENKYDIILMDMEMPVMNGYDTTVVIRNELRDTIPIIAMTAHAMAGEKEKCLSLGMNDYISKPINSSMLFRKIYDLTINL